MKEQNQKMESMLRAIVIDRGLEWQEEDYQDGDDEEGDGGKDEDGQA